MRHTVRRKMRRECTIHSEKVAIQFINLHRPAIWRCQIGRASSQHSVYYPCFTKQERKPLSILGCSEWRIPSACWWPICIISFKIAFSYCTSFKRVGGLPFWITVNTQAWRIHQLVLRVHCHSLLKPLAPEAVKIHELHRWGRVSSSFVCASTSSTASRRGKLSEYITELCSVSGIPVTVLS